MIYGRNQAIECLARENRALHKHGSTVPQIEIILNKYDSKTAVILPVKGSERARGNAAKIYRHCRDTLREVGDVTERVFEGYVVMIPQWNVTKESFSTRMKNGGKIAVNDQYSFNHTGIVSEEEKARIRKLAGKVTITKLYELFPDVPERRLSAMYAHATMGTYERKHHRAITDADMVQINALTKKGMNYKEIAKKLKLNQFQVIAIKAVHARRQNK
ncbi:hypothetical protein HY486_03100 [Candidatus Woesearchaeota archaeon]|nr:hypothetical protein [Candidatus Woesearchaeota archaeon]